MAIALTTNVDLQNYRDRIEQIAGRMGTYGIEVVLTSGNYPEVSDAGKKPFLYTKQVPINKATAVDLGRRLKRHHFTRVQVHFPTQFESIMDSGDLEEQDAYLTLTAKFLKRLREECGAEEFSLTYHNWGMWGWPEDNNRQAGLDYLQQTAKYVKWFVEQRVPGCLVFNENNSAAHNNMFDLVPEDFVHREGLDGITLDYAHAWSVVEGFKELESLPNLEWCMHQYDGIPQSATSLGNFVGAAAPRVRWIHLADDKTPGMHNTQHIGCGNIDIPKSIAILKEHIREDVVATIEIENGHKPKEFRRILEHDFPRLRQLFKLYGLNP